MLGVAMIWIFGWFWGSPRSIATLPPRFSPNAIMGSDDHVLIFGGQLGEYIPGTPALAGQEAVAFKINGSDESLQRAAPNPAKHFRSSTSLVRSRGTAYWGLSSRLRDLRPRRRL
jgi:hypothetical protein